MSSLLEKDVVFRARQLAPEIANIGSESLGMLMSDDVAWRQCSLEVVEVMSRLMPGKVSLVQYNSAVVELMEMASDLEKNPNSSEEMIERVVGKIMNGVKGIERERVESLVRANPLSEDLAWISQEAQRLGLDLETINKDAKWFLNPLSGHVFKYIGEEALDLLRMYRLLGLIPLETIRKLGRQKIAVAGASASARLVDMLVALGAKDLLVVDKGLVSTAKLSLYPGFMGSSEADGMYKVVALLAQIAGRNPYAKLDFRVGLVKPDGETMDPGDLSFGEFGVDKDEILEVVDDPWIKSKLRKYFAKYFPNIPIVFIADLGNQPVAGIEYPSGGQHFHQDISPSEWERMQSLAGEIAQGGKLAIMGEALKAVWRMVKKELPSAHALQFVYCLLGMMPSWSQSAIAGEESAVIASKLILSHLSGGGVYDKNYQGGNVKSALVPKFTRKQQNTLNKVMSQLFVW